MKKILDLEKRKNIYHLIVKNPGLNLSTIAEMLQMSVPLVDYHTQCMVDDGLLTTVKEGGYKRYYIRDVVGSEDRNFLGMLRQETPLKIVLFLLENPHTKHKELLKHFDLAPSTLSYHLTKLVKKGIISSKRAGDEKGYAVRNRKEVMSFLIQYKPSRVLQRFKETWDEDFRIP